MIVLTGAQWAARVESKNDEGLEQDRTS